MEEWLQAFYLHIGSRRVLRLMDNFKAHQAGLQLAPAPSNVRIQWLPANSASKFQPLDQGIIHNMKVFYRKQLLRFMITRYEEGHDPMQELNLFLACQWVIRARNEDITNMTIYNCFRKSTILQANPIELPIAPDPDLSSLCLRARNASGIQDTMNLANFLNPEGEDEDLEEGQDPEDPLFEILSTFHEGIDPGLDQAAEEEDDSTAGIPVEITPNEALKSLQTVLQFQLRQKDAETTEIRALQRVERELQLKAFPSEQMTLNSRLTN